MSTSSLREAFLAAQNKHDEHVNVEQVAATSPPLQQALREWEEDAKPTLHLPAPRPAPTPVGPPAKWNATAPAPTAPSKEVQQAKEVLSRPSAEDQPVSKGPGKGYAGRTQPRGDGYAFAPTNNVTRETFDYVRDHPGVMRAEVVRALGERGFNKGSVSSLLGQMLAQQQIYRKDGKLYVGVAEFRPLKSGKARAEMNKAYTISKKAAPAPKKAAAPTPTSAPVQLSLDQQHREATPPPTPAPRGKDITEIMRAHTAPAPQQTVASLRDMDADAIIEALGLKQALALYVKLKEVFSA